MKISGTGGGNTVTGIKFEREVDFLTSLEKMSSYKIADSQQGAGHDVFYRDELVARCFKKYDFYRFLDEKGVDWRNLISKRLVPDDALFLVATLPRGNAYPKEGSPTPIVHFPP